MKSNNSKSKSGLVKISLMVIITICVHILTLVKSTVVASSFGTSEGMDAYNFANSIVSFIFGIVASGVSTIIIPEYANKKDRRIVDTFITVIYGSTLITIATIILLRFPIIGLFGNKSELFSTIAANVIVFLLISQFMKSFSGVTDAYFQCENKHNIPKLINLICQVLVIIVLINARDQMSILQYAMIISSGNALCFVIEFIVAISNGWRFRPACRFNKSSIETLIRFVPVIFSGGVYQLSLLVDSMIASSLSTGMITVLSYSIQISSIASSVIVGNLLLYIFPKITRGAKNSGYQELFWEQSRGLHAIVCLMIAGFASVGRETVFLLLNHGNFSSNACEIVFYASTIYIMGQGISIIRDMVYRYFYAIGNTKIPAQNSILVSICNITISLVLVKFIGFYGIILGTVISSLISLTVIMIRFHKNVGFVNNILSIIMKFLKNFLIMILTVFLVYLSKRIIFIDNKLMSIFVYGIETVSLYATFQFFVNKEAINAIKKI